LSVIGPIHRRKKSQLITVWVHPPANIPNVFSTVADKKETNLSDKSEEEESDKSDEDQNQGTPRANQNKDKKAVSNNLKAKK
jgi:hypothetical protein